MSNEPTRSASSATTPPSEMTATSVVPPPTSITMLPIGSWIGSPAPIAAAIGCSIRNVCAAPARRAASSTARCSTCVIADGTQIEHARAVQPVDARALEQQPDHPLRDLEVGDRAAAQRPHRDDVARRAADHLPRLLTHREHVLRAAVERDHRRLVEDDPLRARVDERVRRTEVDREIASHGAGLYSAGRRRRGRRFGCERAQAALELVDAVLHRARPAVAKQDRRDADRAGERRRTTGRPRRVPMPRCSAPSGFVDRRAGSGCSSSAQSEPPVQCSCFQIGADLLQRVDADSARRRTPRRGGATRPRPRPTAPRARGRRRGAAARPVRGRASGAGPRRRSRPSRAAPALRTPRRSSRARRRVLRRDRARRRRRSRPRRRAASSPTTCSASTGSAASVSATQSRVSVGGGSTANSVRNESRCLPGAANSGDVGRGRRDANASLHSIAMGYARRRARSDGVRRRDDDVPRRRRRRSPAGARSRPARSALDAPERALAARRPRRRHAGADHRPMWTATLVAGRRGRDPDARRARRGRRDRSAPSDDDQRRRPVVPDERADRRPRQARRDRGRRVRWSR